MAQSQRKGSRKPWTRPPTRIPALALSGTELSDLLCRELNEANMILDEWEALKTRKSSAKQQ